jgi:hypothetical protein
MNKKEWYEYISIVPEDGLMWTVVIVFIVWMIAIGLSLGL